MAAELTLARGQTRSTATGECTGCHIVYQVDLRVRQPFCPDCGDPVLVRDGQSEPERTPDEAHGFNRPRWTQTSRRGTMKPGCGIAAALLALVIAIDLLNGPPHLTIGIPLYALFAVIAFENPAAALTIAAGGLGLGLVLWRLCRRC